MDDATEVFQPLRPEDPQLVGGYRPAARLGAGGMGRVYLSHTRGGRPVAIKVVRPELADDPAFRRRFRREIKAARRVRGAFTAEVIDADADGEPPWLATLYVPGPSLTEAVARRGPLPVPAALWLMAGVAEALEVIHGAGIVHRDLKPSNVLLASDGPRVIDFGISLTSGGTAQTATGTAIGTPQYMAPEQASAGEITPASDVFALGQTVAFAVLGQPLYGDGPSVGVLYRIVHSPPDLSPVPARLRPLVAACLAADPAERATPAEIVAWCRQELGEEADAGAGPAVWQEVTGPEATVPSPVPGPAPVPEPSPAPDRFPVPGASPPHGSPVPDSGYVTVPTAVSTRPVQAWPSTAWPEPAGPPEPRNRRRVAVLVTAVVAAAVLLLTGLTWTVSTLADRVGHRGAATSSASGPEGSERSSSSTPVPPGGPRRTPGPAAEAGDTAPETSRAPSAPPARPRAVAYPLQWLDAKNSLSVEEPVERKNRTGDIRLVCAERGCALESRTSVMTMLYTDPGATLDTCRAVLDSADSHRLPLAAAAAGSEICVKHPSGDIALLVIQVKSTALPASGVSFVTADMTVWRAR